LSRSRLEVLTELVEKNPKDSFARYGLAMELAQQAEFDKALEHFRTLLKSNPDYAAAYYQAGQLLKEIGQTEEARRLFQQGIEVTGRQGNFHAQSELRAALEEL